MGRVVGVTPKDVRQAILFRCPRCQAFNPSVDSFSSLLFLGCIIFKSSAVCQCFGLWFVNNSPDPEKELTVCPQCDPEDGERKEDSQEPGSQALTPMFHLLLTVEDATGVMQVVLTGDEAVSLSFGDVHFLAILPLSSTFVFRCHSSENPSQANFFSHVPPCDLHHNNLSRQKLEDVMKSLLREGISDVSFPSMFCES